ncbi:cache domain-containing sensor histidine kinase [Paenibacillus alba]|uniref:Sensor histidine kinase n=1 Tax=Paenibacillus alba TaxID=1197127 RepID=A0ABU6GD30_9BACL|nr:sensor histidine kinase [Paenibacillus alba]MEC0232128.1 sensor histidine kinase [Paenibacillus alba]
MPLRIKLLFLFAPLIIIAVGITGIFTYRIASGLMETNIREQQENLTRQTMIHLDYVAKDAIDISDYLYLSPEIHEMLTAKDHFESSEAAGSTFNVINRLMTTRQFFHSLILYSKQADPIEFNTKGVSGALPFTDFVQTEFYKKVMEHPDYAKWDYTGPERQLFIGDSSRKVTLTRAIKDVMDPRVIIGFLVIGINETEIRNSYAGGSLIDTDILILNQEGMVLSSTLSDATGKSVSELKQLQGVSFTNNTPNKPFDYGDKLISYGTSHLSELQVIVIQSKNRLMKEIQRILLVTVLSMSCTFVVVMALSWFGASAITKPLSRILASMLKFQNGDFSQQVDFHSNDELGKLGRGYNQMVRRIDVLITDVYRSELHEKEAKLKLLQSQINPHFLYNVLDTIAWTSRQQGNPQVALMIGSLSQMFRLRLNNGKDTVTLREELTLIDNYLSLQNMRFQDRLAYEFAIQPDLMSLPMPSMLLQPLIENSVIHGLEPLKEKGLVQLRVAADSEECIVDIIDNGMGIAEETLRQLQAKLTEKGAQKQMNQERGFAIYNIKERLHMFYGNEAKIEITSSLARGTHVRLVIPFPKGWMPNV